MKKYCVGYSISEFDVATQSCCSGKLGSIEFSSRKTALAAMNLMHNGVIKPKDLNHYGIIDTVNYYEQEIIEDNVFDRLNAILGIISKGCLCIGSKEEL